MGNGSVSFLPDFSLPDRIWTVGRYRQVDAILTRYSNLNSFSVGDGMIISYKRSDSTCVPVSMAEQEEGGE